MRTYLYEHDVDQVIEECLALCRNKKTRDFLESLLESWHEEGHLTESQMGKLNDIYEEIDGRY